MAKQRAAVKYLMISLVICAALLIGATMWISSHYKRIIQQQLPIYVAKASGGAYWATLSDIDFNFVTRSVILHGIKITTDSNVTGKSARAIQVTANINKIEASGIHLWKMITGKGLVINSIKIHTPDATIFLSSSKRDTSAPHPSTPSDASLAILVKKIAIIDPRIAISKTDSLRKTASYFIQGGTTVFMGCKAPKDSLLQPGAFGFADSAHIEVDTFHYTMPDGYYAVSTSNISFSSHGKSLSVSNLSFHPELSESAFYKRKGHRHEIYRITCPKLRVLGWDWEAMQQNQAIAFDTVKMTNANFDIFFSKLYPVATASKMGTYPHQLLLNAPVPIRIKKISLNNCKVKYTEVSDLTEEKGSVWFDQIIGSVSNITNEDSLIDIDSHCRARLKGLFMSKAPFQVRIDLKLHDTSGAFVFDGNVQNIKETHINPIAMALGMAKVNSLNVSDIDVHVAGDEHSSTGLVTMQYTDLEVTILKYDKDDDLTNKKLMSFLANKVAILPHNPMQGHELRHTPTQLDRDEKKGYFNHIWKNIFQGIKNSAMRHNMLTKLASKKSKDGNTNSAKQQEQPEKKRGLLRRLFKKNN